jgi:exopolysaccharide biosynthesis polyprenyl glycosylphosphotransferase
MSEFQMRTIETAFATRRREMVHTLLLVTVDLVAMLVAFDIGRAVRGLSNRPFAHQISAVYFDGLMLATIPLWVAVFALCGLYRVPVNRGRISEAGRVAAAVWLGTTILITADYLSFNEAIFPSHSVPIIAAMIAIPLDVAGRHVVRAVMRHWFMQGRGLYNVLVVGTGDLAARIVTHLDSHKSGYRLLGLIGAGHQTAFGRPVFPSLETALSRLSEVPIHQIIQADPDLPRSHAAALMEYASSEGMAYRFVPDRFGVYAAASHLSTIDGVPVLDVRLTALDGWGAVGKRVFDFAGAALLIVVLAPVMLVIAGLIKIAEPDAPVLYTQLRLGQRGRRVGVLKFRTMVWKYSTGPDREYKTAESALAAMGREDLIAEFRVNQKLDEDPRVSVLGAALRKTSLDELPQLFNALRGDLSLVGPRPITAEELERYGVLGPSFIAMKPGITGLWQVKGRSSTTYDERVELDLCYAENWSLGMDLSILVRTVVSVASRRGAV